MKIRFFNGKILCIEPKPEILQGELHTADGTISYCGPSIKGIDHTLFDREIDLRGNLLLPGFKNAHTHSAMTFLRSYADDMPLNDWLHKQIFPMEAKLTPEDIYTLSKLGIAEYLTSGITSNFDMYIDSEPIARASIDTGFRTVIVSGLNNFVDTIHNVAKNYETLNRCHPLISYQLGFHAEYTTNEELLIGLSELSHHYKAPVYTHISETRQEVLDCQNRTNRSPVAYLNSLGLFDYGGGGYHCVHFSEEDKQIFQEKNMSVITNPASNLKLASGIPPLADYLKAGLNIAIGTDGPASNNCLDMFREMFLVTGLSKVREEDAASFDAVQVLKAATIGGARAMKLPLCESLAVGQKADLFVLNLHKPNMQPENNIIKNIVYSGSKDNVMLTMVNGKILYENGEFFIGEDIGELYYKCNHIIKCMTK